MIFALDKRLDKPIDAFFSHLFVVYAIQLASFFDKLYSIAMPLRCPAHAYGFGKFQGREVAHGYTFGLFL